MASRQRPLPVAASLATTLQDAPVHLPDEHATLADNAPAETAPAAADALRSAPKGRHHRAQPGRVLGGDGSRAPVTTEPQMHPAPGRDHGGFPTSPYRSRPGSDDDGRQGPVCRVRIALSAYDRRARNHVHHKEEQPRRPAGPSRRERRASSRSSPRSAEHPLHSWDSGHLRLISMFVSARAPWRCVRPERCG